MSTTPPRRPLGVAPAPRAATALLAACGSGPPGQTADADAEAGDREVVEFWHHTFTTPENEWYEQVVEDFNASQDEIFVNATGVPGDDGRVDEDLVLGGVEDDCRPGRRERTGREIGRAHV